MSNIKGDAFVAAALNVKPAVDGTVVTSLAAIRNLIGSEVAQVLAMVALYGRNGPSHGVTVEQALLGGLVCAGANNADQFADDVDPDQLDRDVKGMLTSLGFNDEALVIDDAA